MCGIFIALSRGRPVDLSRARAALGRLAHRGPDGSGEALLNLEATAGSGAAPMQAFLGHRRLAILDLSARSAQPYRRGPLSLVYNGEIYDYRCHRAELVSRGARIETDGDVEVLLEILAADGLAGLTRLNGMWAFGLLDEKRDELVAARDRYGKKPLFYYLDETLAVLASEAGAIHAYLGCRPRLRREALDTYLAHGWLFPDPSGRTHLEGIREVRPGCAVRLDLSSWALREEPYADLASHIDRSSADPQCLEELLETAVLDRLVSDRNVGLLLSGGIDSSLILAILAARNKHGEVNCYVGEAGKSEDAAYAAAAADAAGIKTTVVPLDYGGSGLDRFLDICRHQEKPFPFIGNVLAMPQMYEAIAATGVPVMLDGTGGDEIFGGYFDRYLRFAVADAALAGNDTWISAASEGHRANARVRDIIAETTALVSSGAWQEEPRKATWDGQNRIQYLEDFVCPVSAMAPSSDPLAHCTGSFDEVLLIDATAGRLQEWLWQNDRNAMRAGIENRSPFLDWRLAPFIKTGYAAKMSGPWNKLELRALFDRFTPLPTAKRLDKQGFRFVYGRFLRQNAKRVLELIRNSTIMAGRVAVASYVDRASREPDLLASELTQRLLCLAGLEQAMDLKCE
ncbi:MAG: asparagine synthase (glutamine-hydrolyzing) [Hyphomicrobiaceae bacterium]|nr:MAG: asparagine synthase (glutamine-hydrolyzing) [Hyphomicrobiaceae bacterium]